MKNLSDPKTKIYPSTMRGGKELPSSSALDSPSVMSKFATPTPASAIRSDMSHVIDDATSTMHDTYDETTSMLDTTVLAPTPSPWFNIDTLGGSSLFLGRNYPMMVKGDPAAVDTTLL